jgi:terminase small subunit-like protein
MAKDQNPRRTKTQVWMLMMNEILPTPTPSRRLVRIKRDEAVRRLSRKIVSVSPWLTPADGPIVRAWSQLERLAMEAYERLRSDGIMRPDGSPHPLLAELTRLRRAQSQIGSQLGLGPRARTEVQAGSQHVPLEGVFERIERAHAERHSDDG